MTQFRERMEKLKSMIFRKTRRISYFGAGVLFFSFMLHGCVRTGLNDANKTVISKDTGTNVGISLSSPKLPDTPLSLEQAIEIALSNNPEFSAASHDKRAAEARYKAARGGMLPKISAVAGYSRYLDNQRLVPARDNGEPGVFGKTIISSDIVASLPIFTGGRLSAETRAAKLLSLSAGHRLARTEDELVFDVSLVFYSILVQERLIESLDFSKKVLQEHLERVDNLIAAQKAAKVDRLRTEVRMTDLNQRSVREKNALIVQNRTLVNLLGFAEMTGSLKLSGMLAEESVITGEIETHIAQATEHRSDYLAAKSEMAAQAERVKAAQAQQLPLLSLQGAYGGRWNSDFNDSEDVGRIGIGMEIPLFQGGQIRAHIIEEQERLLSLNDRLNKFYLRIRLDVETAVLNLTTAGERAQTTKKAIEQARESFRIESEKYELGKGAIVDVLDAQAALLEAETNYYLTLADLNIAAAQLKLAKGEH